MSWFNPFQLDKNQKTKKQNHAFIKELKTQVFQPSKEQKENFTKKYTDVHKHESLDIIFIKDFLDEFIILYVKATGLMNRFSQAESWFRKYREDLVKFVCEELDKIVKDGNAMLIFQDEFEYNYYNRESDGADSGNDSGNDSGQGQGNTLFKDGETTRLEISHQAAFDSIMTSIYIATNYNIKTFVTHEAIQEILKNHGMGRQKIMDECFWKEDFMIFIFSIVIYLFYPIFALLALFKPFEKCIMGYLNYPLVEMMLPIWGQTLIIYVFSRNMHNVIGLHSKNLESDTDSSHSCGITASDLIHDQENKSYIEFFIIIWWLIAFTIQEFKQMYTESSIFNPPLKDAKFLEKFEELNDRQKKEKDLEKPIQEMTKENYGENVRKTLLRMTHRSSHSNSKDTNVSIKKFFNEIQDIINELDSKVIAGLVDFDFNNKKFFERIFFEKTIIFRISRFRSSKSTSLSHV